MKYIKALSIVGMLIWSLIHVFISPYFLEEKKYIHAALIIGWGEILIYLAYFASKNTWLERKIIPTNTIYGILFFALAILSYKQDSNYAENITFYVLAFIGTLKLIISLYMEESWSKILLFLLTVIIGAYQSYNIIQNQSIEYLPIALDIVIFLISIFLALSIINDSILSSILVSILLLFIGIILIASGTWIAYQGLNWILSGIIIGKGVASIAIPAFKR